MGFEKSPVAGACDLDPGGVNQTVEHVVGLGAKRDALHSVGQVLVETGEETEAVLARQRTATRRRRVGYRDAARLAAEVRARSGTSTANPRSASSCAALNPPTPPPRTTIQLPMGSPASGF